MSCYSVYCHEPVPTQRFVLVRQAGSYLVSVTGVLWKWKAMRNNDALTTSGDPQPDGEADLDRLTAFSQYRALLFSIAYRMVGSVADAEDLLQETFIRWQQAADSDIRSPKAFLITIVSRLCINHLQSARVQREEYVL